MSVVLRCPNCGTTAAHAGECEACHETEVRYFCSNHTPGLWLDTSSCPTCGARFGVADRRPPAVEPPPARTRPSVPRASITSRPSAPIRPRTRAPDYTDELGRAPPPAPLWQSLLKAALRARYLSPRALPHRERAPVGPGLGGCLRRLIMLVLLLLLALAGAVFFLGRSLLGGSGSF